MRNRFFDLKQDSVISPQKQKLNIDFNRSATASRKEIVIIVASLAIAGLFCFPAFRELLVAGPLKLIPGTHFRLFN
jgi:hypothetical protein